MEFRREASAIPYIFAMMEDSLLMAYVIAWLRLMKWIGSSKWFDSVIAWLGLMKWTV